MNEKPTRQQAVRITAEARISLDRLQNAIRATSGFTLSYAQIVAAALHEYERLVAESTSPATTAEEPPSPLAAPRPLPRQRFTPAPKPR